MDDRSKERAIREWMEMCLSAGFPYMSLDTCVKVLVVFDLYNSEDMTFCPRLAIDLDYIRRRFRFEGGESPDPDFVEAVNRLRSPLMRRDEAPDWAKDLFRERYGAYIAGRRTVGADDPEWFSRLTNQKNQNNDNQ